MTLAAIVLYYQEHYHLTDSEWTEAITHWATMTDTERLADWRYNNCA